MHETDASESRDAIERLEAQIEMHAQAIERCRKIALISRLAIIAGAAWFGLVWLGIAMFFPAGLLVALAALIGGTVAFGANFETQKRSEAALDQAEIHRKGIIERLELRVVEERRQLH